MIGQHRHRRSGDFSNAKFHDGAIRRNFLRISDRPFLASERLLNSVDMSKSPGNMSNFHCFFGVPHAASKSTGLAIISEPNLHPSLIRNAISTCQCSTPLSLSGFKNVLPSYSDYGLLGYFVALFASNSENPTIAKMS